MPIRLEHMVPVTYVQSWLKWIFAPSSFVCDMSSGFTCNIGQKMPENWAYDQFAEISVANSTFSGMDYDKCIASPRKTATAPENYIPIPGYDNSRYTYDQVLSGMGYYQFDSQLRYSLWC